MRKRLLGLVVAVAVGGWLLGSMAQAQPSGRMGSDSGSDAQGACCNLGSPAVPEGQQCLLLHKVGPGENLHILSAYYYGDARAWGRIYNLNRRNIRNPNKIVVGQVLRIEVPPCWTPRFDLQEFLRLEAQRVQVLQAAPGERPREVRTHEVVQTKVSVSVEAGGTEQPKPGAPPAPGGPTIPAPVPGGPAAGATGGGG